MGLRTDTSLLWHLIAFAVVAGIAAFLLSLVARRLSRIERRGLWAALIVHMTASFALLFVILEIYGVGDVVTFFRQGELLVRYFHADGDFSELVLLILQRPVRFPFLVLGIGSPTGTMSGLATILLMVTQSLWVGNLVAALLAFSGQVALYLAVRPRLEAPQRPRALLALLFVPSAAFWCGGLVKEAMAIAGIGWIVYGLSALGRHIGRGVLLVGAGALLVGLTKPYFLMPLGLATAVFWYWNQAIAKQGLNFRVRPRRLLLAFTVGLAGVLIFGEVFPTYSVANLGEQAATQQLYGSRVAGGSNYDIGATGADLTLLQQLAFAPLGLVSALFRPFLFEVSNPAILVNALESTVLTLLAVRVVWRRGLGGTWRALRTSPLLMACLAFALLAGVGIGVVSTNLGSLSRYRAPMQPFYVLLLLLLDYRSRRPPPTVANRLSHRSTTVSSS